MFCIDILQVTKKEFKFASRHNLPFFFVSAADGTNVVKVFHQAIREAISYKQSGEYTVYLYICMSMYYIFSNYY